jgi:hypothetical protein
MNGNRASQLSRSVIQVPLQPTGAELQGHRLVSDLVSHQLVSAKAGSPRPRTKQCRCEMYELPRTFGKDVRQILALVETTAAHSPGYAGHIPIEGSTQNAYMEPRKTSNAARKHHSSRVSSRHRKDRIDRGRSVHPFLALPSGCACPCQRAFLLRTSDKLRGL